MSRIYQDRQTGEYYKLVDGARLVVASAPQPKPPPTSLLNLPELLTTAELGTLLRVQPQAIRRRIERGDIQAVKPLGSGRWRIPKVEALRILRGGGHDTNR